MAEPKELAPAVRLLARLHAAECDALLLAILHDEPIRAALAAWGIDLPSADDLTELAEAWCARYLLPKTHLPPVQSLWVHGGYEGPAAQRLRDLAKALGMEQRSDFQSLPPDHLGAILDLYAAALEAERSDVAEALRAEHFGWARPFLQRLAQESGFYASLARATLEFFEVE